jgi:hypothetical protein
LIHLFALAEKYNIVSLADEAMDFLIKMTKAKNWLPTTTDMTMGYRLTHQKSGLRLFLARPFVYLTLHCTPKIADRLWDNVKMQKALMENEGLFTNVFEMLRLQAGKLQVDPREQPACDYHQHAKTEACPYLKK